ncbi:MAG: 3-phosphoshikimate 1-carboxyvinyltransferase [Bacteroidetes bacterium]|nr:MAG: 3-phosphoshikimate 1-carboxyvinyltransferase [Bacteroidota bacterium]
MIAPPSKSQSIRALAGASLCKSESIIYNYSKCDDAIASIEIIKALGSDIKYVSNDLIISGGKPEGSTLLNCVESAFCLRLFSAIASLYNYEIELTAEKSLLKRKTENIENILKTIGAECKTDNGYPPIKVKGPIKGGNIKIDCSKSSQLLSGLLFSLPLAMNDSTIEVTNLKSRPYIDLTLETLSKFGIIIQNDKYELFKIKGGQNYHSAKINIEGDWSCASNFLVAGAINGEVTITNLNHYSFQGDKVIVDILKDIGADITNYDNSINVSSNVLNSFEFDAGDCPDLVPILTVLACSCEGESIISDISRLAGKESSRVEIIAKELISLGGILRFDGDRMRIEKATFHGGRVNSHGDHRIAMALAVAGLNGSAPITIENTECVSKSYPGFWSDIELLSQ